MKELFESIWNAPKESIITGIAVIAGIFVTFAIISTAIVARNFKKKQKEFDDRFNSFGSNSFKK